MAAARGSVRYSLKGEPFRIGVYHCADCREESGSVFVVYGQLLGALGVVFGDIGTSSICAFRESLKAAGGASEAAVFGVLSFVFWAIILVVAIKYMSSS